MKKLLAASGLVVLAALTGCARQGAPPSAPTVPAPTPAAPSVANPSQAPIVPEPPSRQAVIYTVDLAHGTDTNHYLVAKTIALANPQDPAREAMEALVENPNSPLPAGTHLRSIKITDGLATVDFSRSPVDETGGEEQQSQTLEAIQRTLGQFPNVSRIQILVAGQPVSSLGQAAGGPLDVLRPGETMGEAGGA